MTRFTQADLNDINKTFEDRSPEDLLRWAKDIFGERVAVLSAMQQSGSMVCHMLAQEHLKMPVLFVDTGVNFQETLEMRDALSAAYGLKIITLTPEQSMQDQIREFGILYLTPEGQKSCCYMRKIEPLLKIKGQYDCLIGGLRRAEGGKRANIPILSIDPQMNCIRANPLANVTDDQLKSYLIEHRVIVNPLHAQGYTTIGCNRCTTPVLPDEPKRAGRWRHLGMWSAYCEINATDRDGGSSKSVDLPSELIERLLGQKTDFAI